MTEQLFMMKLMKVEEVSLLEAGEDLIKMNDKQYKQMGVATIQLTESKLDTLIQLIDNLDHIKQQEQQ